MNLQKDIKLAEFTTFKIGGIAKYFVRVTTVAEALEAVSYAVSNHLPVFVLGGGSNVVISDSGFEGLVVKNEIKGFKVKGNFITAGAGENWDDVVKRCIDIGLQGIECLSAIPGTFGGAVVQNVGAYSQTLGDVIDSVEAIDVATGHLQIFPKSQCGFSYRKSIFKDRPGEFIITAAILKLHEINRANISYPSLKQYYEGLTAPTLIEGRNLVIELRAAKGMVIMPEYESYRSAGSFFKNPIISGEQFKKLQPKIKCPDPWFWLEADNVVKVSAACLIIQSGFAKGQSIDGAQISPKQPLAIINPGHATAADIRHAADKIKQKVMEKFGISLEEEVLYVGKIK